MSWLKRMFDRRHRRARAAEGAGRWRRAAELWAEAGESERAAEALLHLAVGATDLEERLSAWRDALHFTSEDDEEQQAEIERKMAYAILEDATHRGAASAEEKRRLNEAADSLEHHERPAAAAEAYAMLGLVEDQARCLEAAGEVEKLEALLEKANAKEESSSRLRRLLTDYEMALRYGARLEARSALRQAMREAPDDRTPLDLLRRLEARMPPPGRVRLRVDGKRTVFVGRLPAVIGRGEVDLPIRGTSVSRRHAEVALVDEILIIRDLDSRNGTLVRGVPIGAEIELRGATEIGLGDDVTVGIRPLGSTALVMDVRSGFDRGDRIVVGKGELPVDGAPAVIHFEDGWPILSMLGTGKLSLDGQICALPVHLLIDDRLSVDGVNVEVVE